MNIEPYKKIPFLGTSCLMFHTSRNTGQVALTAVLFFLVAATAIGIGFTSFALEETSTTRKQLRAKQSYFLAEAGIEDAMYRVREDMTIGTSEVLNLDGQSQTTDIVTVGNNKEITARATYASHTRNIKTVLAPSTSDGTLNYGLQVGYLGLDMKNKARVNGNVKSNGSIRGVGSGEVLITGDAFVAGGVGNTPHVSQSSGSYHYDLHKTTSRLDVAQRFKAASTAKPNKLTIYIKKFGTPGNLEVRVVADDNGDPDYRNDIGSATIATTDISSSAYDPITVYFNSTGITKKDFYYWIIIGSSPSASATNYYELEGEGASSYTEGRVRYTQDWTNSGAVWAKHPANLSDPENLRFAIYMGEETTYIEKITIGQNPPRLSKAWAQTLNDVVVHGFASSTEIKGGSTIYREATCDTLTSGNVDTEHGSPNSPNCTWDVASPAPSTENDPFPSATLVDLKNAIINGEDGCTTYNGNYALSADATTTMDCMAINGDFDMSGKARVLLRGNLYVSGVVRIQNYAQIHMDPVSFGSRDGFIISDGNIELKNDARLRGNIGSGIYLFLITLSTNTGASPSALLIQNDANVDAIYSAYGFVEILNHPKIKSAFGQGLNIQNDAEVNYEIGIADASFTGGPGGGWGITTWREVE